jgi:predicted transcriptional regulator
LLAICITLMQIASMTAQTRPSVSGLTVRLAPNLRSQVDAVARAEHRSAAANIEALVEQDLRAREENARVIRLYVAAGLPDKPDGNVVRGEDEPESDYQERAALLDFLSGV